MPNLIAKPVSPRIYQRAGAPVFWALMDSPRRDGAGGPGDVADLTGRSRALSRSAGCVFTTGPVGGRALDCSASGTATLAAPLALGTTYSLSARVLHRAFAAVVLGGENAFYGWYYDGTNLYHRSGNLYAQAACSISLNTWVTLGVTRSGATTSLYLNGVLQGSGTVDQSFNWQCLSGNSPSGNPLDGQLDDLRVYDRELTPAEIARDYADPFWRLRPTLNVALLFAGLPVITLVSASDSGTGADAASLVVSVSVSEAGTGADIGTLLAAIGEPDTAVGTESAALAALVSTSDAGTGAESASLGVTLYDALRARLLSGEPRLTDCYRRQPPDKAFTYPYAIYNDLNESPDWVSQVNVYPSWVNVQVTVVSPDDLEAEDVRDSCYLLFTPKRNHDGSPANPPLVFGDGGMTSGGFNPGLKTQYRSPGRSADGRPLWLFSFALRLFITRGM